ncbi:DUF3619 family protein [Aquabacterium sp.]|uniref:DUF3619 family protein n=1 Tax=Aquabacterium sp. TaxID=1872578 RepID=UPI0025BB3ECF|nr:DUF3619 family protein [Aquabacterium sp.]
MKTRPTTPLTAAQREALEARFALRLSARLEEGAQAVPHDISERLRVAREQAVRTAREARVKALSPVAAPAQTLPELALAGAGAGPAAPSGPMGGLLGTWQESSQSRQPGHGRRLDDGPVSWGWRIASALPIIALLAGLWGVQRYNQHEQVQAATDVDMALLTDDLPPSAYVDPGFEEFLRHNTGPATEVEAIQPPDIEVRLDASAVEDPAPAVPADTPAH